MSSRQPPPQPPAAALSVPENGAELVPYGHRMKGKLGGKTAQNRFDWYVQNSGPLTVRQMVTLEVVARLEITFWNASSILEKAGVLTVQDQPRALLARSLQLQAAIRDGLAEVYGPEVAAADSIVNDLRSGR